MRCAKSAAVLQSTCPLVKRDTAGFCPAPINSIWLAIFAPAATPEPVLARLREELKRALESPDTKEKLNNAGGLEPFFLAGPEFSALIQRDYEKYGKVVKEVGVKLD